RYSGIGLISGTRDRRKKNEKREAKSENEGGERRQQVRFAAASQIRVSYFRFSLSAFYWPKVMAFLPWRLLARARSSAMRRSVGTSWPSQGKLASPPETVRGPGAASPSLGKRAVAICC